MESLYRRDCNKYQDWLHIAHLSYLYIMPIGHAFYLVSKSRTYINFIWTQQFLREYANDIQVESVSCFDNLEYIQSCIIKIIGWELVQLYQVVCLIEYQNPYKLT